MRNVKCQMFQHPAGIDDDANLQLKGRDVISCN